MKIVRVLSMTFSLPVKYSSSVRWLLRTPSIVQLRYSAGGAVGRRCERERTAFAPGPGAVGARRRLGLGPTASDFEGQAGAAAGGPLSRAHAAELVLRLNDDERGVLFAALQEYESTRIKEHYQDKLAGQRWRTKLGRPSRLPALGDVDPTGTYCPVPDDWLKNKYAASVQKPTTKELIHLSMANSIPFIGFGFLDNFIMIIAGDRIESSMSAYITLSTMAAAALGNTFSDVVGIGSSLYVERAAAALGLGAPALAPAQLDLPASRRAANLGRVLGITLGCFLGMTPLLFKDDEKAKQPAATTAA